LPDLEGGGALPSVEKKNREEEEGLELICSTSYSSFKVGGVEGELGS